jgi:glutamyl-tRNA synthetase
VTTHVRAQDEAVLDGLRPEEVRVRFPPSPTGNLHVGNVRSALFNWAFARHYGGTFVLRIEDTDAGRNLEESYTGLLDALTWLGLHWDEGPVKGGPYGPYIQSERGEIYRDVVTKLLAAGSAYRCYCTREEIEAREAARPAGTPPGYDGFCRSLPPERVAQLEAVGAPSVVRMLVPDEPIEFDDLVRGPIAFAPEHVPDYVIVRSNGEPLYTLVNPVDDSLMRVTHVLRGEDLLPSTPRQIVLYRACPSGTRAPGWPSTASAGTCPRRCSTTWPCSAGPSPRTATSSPWRR